MPLLEFPVRISGYNAQRDTVHVVAVWPASCLNSDEARSARRTTFLQLWPLERSMIRTKVRSALAAIRIENPHVMSLYDPGLSGETAQQGWR